MTTWIFALQLIGTVSFAVSGAMTALRKRMDVLGVVVLGLITAVGGGMLRDVLLGRTPPAIFSDPVTVVAAALSSVLVFIPAVRRLLLTAEAHKDQMSYWHLLAIQGHAATLIPLLDGENRRNLLSAFEAQYPKPVQLPVQKELAALLRGKPAEKKTGLLSFLFS